LGYGSGEKLVKLKVNEFSILGGLCPIYYIAGSLSREDEVYFGGGEMPESQGALVSFSDVSLGHPQQLYKS
jgi:hypothetical protein